MYKRNQDINEIIGKIALIMNLKKETVAKSIPVLSEKSIEILEFSLQEKRNKSDDDEWISINPNALIELKLITHPDWDDDFKGERFKELCKEIEYGVKFTFYWKDGFLCWER